ncbi:head-tail connector protein [Bacillus infantis]|uniref:head-tail connector protein n=1 Tax=Bacillus infantis TaxID=324767 RepID=UPI003CF08EFE
MLPSIDNVKTLLEIPEGDQSKDNLIDLYIKRAEFYVKDYCNQEEILPSLQSTVEEIAVIYYLNRAYENVKSIREGDLSQVFHESLPPHIISHLNNNRRLKFV